MIPNKITFFALFLFLTACSTVPISNRKQMTLLPESQMLAMSFNQYNEFLSKNETIQGTKEARQVNATGQKIANAVTRYMRQNGMADRVKDFAWEFNLVKDDLPNAWCMPGGKVVVYEGILPYTQNEDGLAVVMGHEIAHAIARHGNERMSQQLALAAGGMALSVYLEENKKEHKNLFMAAYGAGATLGVMLPYSRAHETEADRLGLIFMTMAGYDPNEAVAFWQRMSEAGGAKPPEFLSTHPANETRINNLKQFIPEALKYKGK